MAVSDKPWSDFTEADYSLDQWKGACLVDSGQGDPDSKDRYKLPVREPNGALNRNGVHAAAARVNQVQPVSKRASAARKLIALYRNELHEDPPDSLTGTSGERSGVPPTERLYTASFSSGLRVETRSLPEGGPAHVIGGYAAVFGKRSHPMGGIREVVEPSFFNKSQADGWPMAVCRYEHDPRYLLGSTAGKTLQLNLDNNGLDYSVRVPETRSDVWELADRGDLPGSSFSFQAYQDDWRLGEAGMPERHLVTGRLIDVAPTAIPAYPDSTMKIQYRSLAAYLDADPGEVEEIVTSGNARVFFHRSDNIDKREKMNTPENRSAPMAELASTPHETHVHVHIEKERDAAGGSESKAAELEPKPEERPEAAAPEATEPEPKVEATSTTAQPEPKPEPEPKEPEVKSNPGEADLYERRLRLREAEAKDFSVQPEKS